jgi:hypothetical protein
MVRAEGSGPVVAGLDARAGGHAGRERHSVLCISRARALAVAASVAAE